METGANPVLRLDLAQGVWAEQVPTPSLGDHSYLVVTGDVAAVIDVQRDAGRIVDGLGRRRLAAVLETHVHNDYVSGGSLLADERGAEYVLPAGSGASVDHRAIADGERVLLAEGWSLRAVATPGHTPHHTAFVLEGPGGPVAAFTGGSMLVGAVGRTDLVAPDLTEGLTRDQHRSVRRLAASLDDPVAVAPTHGAGSFCSASGAGETTSTIARERYSNPALTIDDEDRFVAVQTAGFGLYPAYYRHMAPINREGGGPVPHEPLPAVDPGQAAEVIVVDLRPVEEFAPGHLPGSVNIPLADSTATYAAWVLPWNTPIALRGDEAAIEQARLQLARIGYDRVVGAVGAGRQDGDTGRLRLAAWDEVDPTATVVDVRDPAEAAQCLPGAVRVHVSEVAGADLPDGTLWVHCVTGYRAAIAGSLLAAAGREVVVVADELGRYLGPRVPA
jgi:glyoxylase-like metal-dependent hydrolase (beta-lactamase superfamily II)